MKRVSANPIGDVKLRLTRATGRGWRMWHVIPSGDASMFAKRSVVIQTLPPKRDAAS
jgi:hypothetical protein